MHPRGGQNGCVPRGTPLATGHRSAYADERGLIHRASPARRCASMRVCTGTGEPALRIVSWQDGSVADRMAVNDDASERHAASRARRRARRAVAFDVRSLSHPWKELLMHAPTVSVEAESRPQHGVDALSRAVLAGFVASLTMLLMFLVAYNLARLLSAAPAPTWTPLERT